MQSITSLEQMHVVISHDKAALFYCSTPDCGVCKSLKPKVAALATENFPAMGLYYIDLAAVPEIRGQLSIFAVPAVLVFIQGKETIREARNFGIMELGRAIDRYYSMLFDATASKS
jgi:thioredoxin-like negative regulator of GroEL